LTGGIGVVRRASGALRRHGPAGAIRLLRERVRPNRNEYVWYALELSSADRPRRPLGAGLTLRRGGLEDMQLLEQLPADASVTTLTPEVVAARLDRSAQLWLVTENGRTAFSCWIYTGRAPLHPAVRETVELPPGVAWLEDSIASPHFRGRGVAPAAWSLIADALAAASLSWLVTKVDVENVPSRNAVAKAGFLEAGRLHIESGPLGARVRVQLHGSGHSWMQRALHPS
jgi:RimJ/RimL family protein N-acetyltransferase